MLSRTWPTLGKVLLLGGLAVLAYLASALVYFWSEPSPSYVSPENSKMAASRPNESTRPLRTLWFGHSLMQYRAAPEEGVPAIHIPESVNEIHELARAEGRSDRPASVTVSYYEGPQDLVYWAEGKGKGPERISASKEPWDYVIGVGFMHLVRQRGGRHTFKSKEFAPRNLKDDLTGAVKDLVNVGTFGWYYGRRIDAYTQAKFRLIDAVRSHSESSTWLNYVAPVMSDQPDNQASVDARFSCIQDVAHQAGARVENVPVGFAVRSAEVALQKAGLSAKLQRSDRLHYTAPGAYLASNVFFAYLYDIDPRGLPIPERFAEYFAEPDGKKIAKTLQEVAYASVQKAKAGHLLNCDGAEIPADETGRALLKQN